MTKNPTNKTDQIKEIIKCGRDPVYFMKSYTKIQHPKRGLIPFDTYSFQDDCVKSFEENRFNIILKSRQLGLSTVTAAYSVWFSLFKKDKNVLVIATKLQTAMNFIKKVKTMLDGLPKWLLLAKYEATKQQIRLNNGSTITAIPTSPDAGRSEALSLLIVDEAAFIRDFEDIWTGLYPTLSTGGSAVIISTPNGVGGQYYKLWTDAVAQQNEFNTINLPWWVHPEHDQEWFDKETRNLPKRKVAQEFLCLAEGSRIITRDGYRKIEDLEPGDEVLTHKGRFKKILKTHARKVDEGESLWEVSSPGNRTNPLLITGDHPSLAYRFWANGGSHFAPLKSDSKPDWIPIQEIGGKRKNTDKILNCLFPTLQNETITGEMTSIDLTDLSVETLEETQDTCRYSKQWGFNARHVPVDYNLGKLVGLYLAEGCKSHCGGLDLGFHVNEWDTHVEWVTQYLQSFGCRVKSAKTKGTNGCRVWSYNKYFGSLMRLFVEGDYAPQKRLNMDLLLKTNLEFIRGVLEGHYLGDGNHFHDKKFCVYSTSVKLVYQLRTLYSLFSLHPRIGVCRRAQKNPDHHDTWYLEFFAAGRSYSDLISSGQTVLKGTKIIRHNDYFVGKVTVTDKSDLISEGVTVYDIKVEDDASFVAESLVLHNCDFISSGETFLQAAEMDYLRGMLEPPKRKEGIANAVWVWSDPSPGKRYVISADVARGDAADFSAFHVIDVDSAESVCEFMGKVPPDKFADILLEYGKKYNGAILCPERNTFGYFTCVKLRDSGYKRLWYKNANADMWSFIQNDPEQVPGFETQVNTRSQILGKLEELIRNQVIKIYSQRTYDQLQGFVWHGSKAQAARDAHDDLIMSLAIGMWITHGSSTDSESGREMAMAMLKATGIDRRDHSALPIDYNAVRPIMSTYNNYTPSNLHKPRDSSIYGVSNFNWLLK
jgi:hypothetical protein